MGSTRSSTTPHVSGVTLNYFDLEGCSQAAAFFAEHSSCLEVRDRVFDGSAGFAESGVELGLAGGEAATGESFDRDDLDALDTNVAHVRRG